MKIQNALPSKIIFGLSITLDYQKHSIKPRV